MKYQEITTKSEAELLKELTILRSKEQELRLKNKLGQTKNMHERAGIRKDIARILTYLRAKM